MVLVSVGVGTEPLAGAAGVVGDLGCAAAWLGVAEAVGAVLLVTGLEALPLGAGDDLVAAPEVAAGGVTGWLTVVPIPLQPRQATMANDPNCAAASAPSRLWL